MAAPAIPPIRLGLIGTGLAVERLDAGVHHVAQIHFITHTTVFRAVDAVPFAA
ncbi:hypothetical protein [Saccharothrix sp. NRRL B-16348]|uniref:hypothetical protein n=1 Tax=Saccharothrix sp. NRRL B-16348 TaxID=1415542 RepID=UPI000AE54370|nr:hypothetical protein [Saccharothrix sp. NRRL B-16348]